LTIMTFIDNDYDGVVLMSLKKTSQLTMVCNMNNSKDSNSKLFDNSKATDLVLFCRSVMAPLPNSA
jgi:hypothetical protein